MDDTVKHHPCSAPPVPKAKGLDDGTPNPALHGNGTYFGDVLQRAMARRAFLQGASATAAALVITPALVAPGKAQADANDDSSSNPGHRLSFETVPPGNEPDVVVPPNYQVNVLLRWGDPLTPDAPAFDVNNQNKSTQSQQFGFNCDLILWFALPRFVRVAVQRRGELPGFVSRSLGFLFADLAHKHSQHALLAVNHEYTTGGDMFPDYDPDDPTRDQCEAEIEAHGMSIVHIVQDDSGQWRVRRNSPFNRRITGSTPMTITGPLRGDELVKTSADSEGTVVLGSLNNCAGGRTPWGTVLTCEENFDQYFANFDLLPDDNRSKQLSQRIPAEGGETDRKWEQFDSRYDTSVEPNEYNRFGYIIEIDPYDPSFTPKKRTALGRFKHEGAAAALTKDGQVAIYSGDDAGFEYVYKFVTKGQFDASNRKQNMDLLDDGTLYVARFDTGDVQSDEMGTGAWLPLVWEEGGPLHQAGFANQQEVLLNVRGAADVLEATPMDRPEEVEVSPKNGHVYIALTNNSNREPMSTLEVTGGRDFEIDTGPDESNPRGPNPHGHVVELIEDGDDAGALTFRWNIFLKCGNPEVPEDETKFGDIEDPREAGVSPISDPDNLVFDDDGNLWIATDGQFFSSDAGFGQNDGVFAVPVEGKNRGLLRQFLSSVPGAEVCGPEFSGDNRTFFCGFQHPHDGEAFDKLWPLDEVAVSKPSVIAVREINGQKIGRG